MLENYEPVHAKKALAQYEYFAKKFIDEEIIVPVSHNTLFMVKEYSGNYYQKLYLNQIGKTELSKRPDDANCYYCKQFHTGKRKDINKRSDIKLGNTIENRFLEIINELFISKNSSSLCVRADQENLHNPDLKIINKETNEDILYFEFKVIFRPFVKISEYVSESFLCYNHSLTLDLENGKKLLEQRKLVEEISKSTPVVYLYFYDIPCIKGFFWMESKDVYQIMDAQSPYNRHIVDGDFNNLGQKNSATKKIYLSLTQMKDFDSFMKIALNE
jgi:hypothetical protein